jgi:hypothetical protein
VTAKVDKTGKEGVRGPVGKTGKTGAVGPRWRDIDISKMDEKLDKMISAIYEGNGHKPLMERVAIIEEHMGTMLETSVKRDQAIVTLTKMCADTASTVTGHIDKPHVFSMIGNLKFWGYLVVTFIIAHEIFDVLNPLVAALVKAWTGITLP